MRSRRAGVIVLVAVGCYHYHSEPSVPFTAAPEVPSGPPVPVCSDRALQSQAGVLTDEVTCQGGHLVAYAVLRSAGLAQASRFALTAGRTHVAEVGERNWLTAAAIGNVGCVMTNPDPGWRVAKSYPLYSFPAPQPSCAGGQPLAGTEGHILQMLVSILSPDEAANTPGARRAFDVLGYRDPPAREAGARPSDR